MKSTPFLLAGIILFLSFSYSHLNAQTEQSMESTSIHSIKAGFLGVWYSYEKNIKPQFTLNIEAGADMGFSSGYGLNELNLGFVLIPTLRLEPRLYYNLLKRQEKEKKTLHNSANFLAVSVIGNTDYVSSNVYNNINPAVRIIPMWGIRRALSQHFIFETAIGYGLYIDEYESFGTPGFDLRIGYVF